MLKSRSITRCRHGVDESTCPQCTQEQRDEHEAVLIASRDPETVESWRRDFDAWIATDPRPSLEVANG